MLTVNVGQGFLSLKQSLPPCVWDIRVSKTWEICFYFVILQKLLIKNKLAIRLLCNSITLHKQNIKIKSTLPSKGKAGADVLQDFSVWMVPSSTWTVSSGVRRRLGEGWKGCLMGLRGFKHQSGRRGRWGTGGSFRLKHKETEKTRSHIAKSSLVPPPPLPRLCHPARPFLQGPHLKLT